MTRSPERARTKGCRSISRQGRSAVQWCNPRISETTERGGSGGHYPSQKCWWAYRSHGGNTCRVPLGAGVVRRIVPVPPVAVGQAVYAAAAPSRGKPCWCGWAAVPEEI